MERDPFKKERVEQRTVFLRQRGIDPPEGVILIGVLFDQQLVQYRRRRATAEQPIVGTSQMPTAAE